MRLGTFVTDVAFRKSQRHASLSLIIDGKHTTVIYSFSIYSRLTFTIVSGYNRSSKPRFDVREVIFIGTKLCLRHVTF